MHERQFHSNIERLRAPERQARMEVARVVEQALAGIQPRNMLDIGTGTGLFAEAFAAKGLAVSGLDTNPEMVEAAGQFIPSGEFRQGIAEELPYPDKSFDLVFMGVVLHETDDRLKALQEAQRVARLRVAVLEWPYIEEQANPPLTDRIPAQDIENWAGQAGFTKTEQFRLTNTILYILEV